MPELSSSAVIALVIAAVLVAIPLVLHLVIFPKMPFDKRENPGALGLSCVVVLGAIMLILIWNQPWASEHDQGEMMFAASLFYIASALGTMPTKSF